MQKHVPLVQPHLRRAWHAQLQASLRGTSSLGGGPIYELIALLEFADMDTFLKGRRCAHSDEVMGDVPHFTDIRPIVQFNDSAV